MHADILSYVRRVLMQTRLGVLVSDSVHSDEYHVAMTAFSQEAVVALRTRIVYELSMAHLIRGILDVPLSVTADRAVMWVKNTPIVCHAATVAPYSILPAQPVLPVATCLAIGGPSCVGKTTLVKALRQSSAGNRVKRYISYTTRPKRATEQEGVDYHFIDPAAFETYKNDPRFINFVEARGHWYWSNPSDLFESRWRDQHAIHVFTITQAHEFVDRRIILPDLQWVWLDASPEEVYRRMCLRGDVDIEKSLAQNERLASQDRSGLVRLVLTTDNRSTESLLGELLEFIATAERNTHETSDRNSLQS